MKQEHEPINRESAVTKREPTALRDDLIVQRLDKIHDQLDRAHRKDRQQDFSVLRLFGALLQMIAIVAAVWGFLALVNDAPAAATARFTLACFLQIASISAFVIDRFR